MVRTYKMSSKHLLFAVFMGLCLPASLFSNEVREYTEVYRPPAPPPGHTHQHNHAARAPARITWTAPDTWQEEKGSGMRLASFSIGEGEAAGLCTIITLSGSAGGTESNVRRWLGQMNLEMTDAELQAFLAKQESLSTADGLAGLFVNFLPLTVEPSSPSMLATFYNSGGQTVFVKLTGPASLVKEETARFKELCQSLHIH